MPQNKNPLRQRLDDDKFAHAVSYVQQAAHSIKHLSSSELSHLNEILTGSDDNWRLEAAQVKIPSGDVQVFNVITNPISRAREIIGDALQLVGNQRRLDASLHLYGQLVREHLFKEANRRTAVLAVLWLVEMSDAKIDPLALLQIKVGNLRNPVDEKDLGDKMRALIKPATS